MSEAMKFDTRVRGGKDEWLTPPSIIEALGGWESFDLDPCAPVNRPWPMARNHFTIADDGLRQPWAGRVWLNPPYGSQTIRWIERLREHGNGIALIFARTDTATFHSHVWAKEGGATAILFLCGRLTFCHVSGEAGKSNGGAPSCLIAWGEECAHVLRSCGLPGRLFWCGETAINRKEITSMKVRRVFWIHHEFTGKKARTTKKSTDFDASRSHQDCAEEIYDTHGRYVAAVRRYEDFAEIISSTITDGQRPP